MSIKIDTHELLDLARLLMPDNQAGAQARAINRVAEEARSESQRMMTQDYMFKASDAMVALDKANQGRMNAILKASGKRFSFMYFNAQETETGVSAQIQTGKKTSRRRAFIARPAGNVYKKRGQIRAVNAKDVLALQRKGEKAYPLRKLTGPAPGTILKSKKNMENINDLISRRAETIFQEEINRIFK